MWILHLTSFEVKAVVCIELFTTYEEIRDIRAKGAGITYEINNYSDTPMSSWSGAYYRIHICNGEMIVTEYCCYTYCNLWYISIYLLQYCRA